MLDNIKLIQVFIPVLVALISVGVPVIVRIQSQCKKARRQEELKHLIRLSNDLLTLIAVEEAHCEIHKTNSNKSMKNTVRNQVQQSKNLKVSNSNSRAKLEARLENWVAENDRL